MGIIVLLLLPMMLMLMYMVLHLPRFSASTGSHIIIIQESPPAAAPAMLDCRAMRNRQEVLLLLLL